MRRSTSEPYINWNIRLTLDDQAAIVRLFPMRGARTWLVEEGLGKFLDSVEHNPALLAYCQEQIARMLVPVDPQGVQDGFSCKITSSKYERFNAILPQFGAATWFVRALVKATIQVMDDHTLDQYLDSAVQKVLTP